MNEKLSEILGRDVKQGEVFSDQDLLRIENAIAKPAATTPAATTTTAEVVESATVVESQNDLSTQISSAVASAIAPLTETINSFNQRLDVVEGKPGADSTEAPKVSGDSKKLEAWEDPNSPLNKAIDKDLGL